MKKLIICALTFLSLTFIPAQLKAIEPLRVNNRTVNTTESPEVKTLENRLYEIKAMDKIKLSSKEKKNLRKEVRSIDHRLHEIGGVYYVSGGAILIALILILILL